MTAPPPPWQVTEVSSWEDFVKRAATVLGRMTRPPQYLFRGQPDASWPLTSTLARVLPPSCTPERALEIEKAALDDFRSQAHLVHAGAELPLDMEDRSIIDWWTLMQHYGAPTRLLDWTASPYVAAYFATQAPMERPGAIFIAHPHTVGTTFNRLVPTGRDDIGLFTHPGAPDSVYFFQPRRSTTRLVAQQGHLTLTTRVLGHHGDLIAAASDPRTAPDPTILLTARWHIPVTLKRTFARHLRYMNVSAHSLFPGPDGLGRSVAETVGWLSSS